MKSLLCIFVEVMKNLLWPRSPSLLGCNSAWRWEGMYLHTVTACKTVSKVLQVTQSCSLSCVTPACHDTHKLQDKKSCSRHEGDRPVNPCARDRWHRLHAGCMHERSTCNITGAPCHLTHAGQGDLCCIHDTILHAVSGRKQKIVPHCDMWSPSFACVQACSDIDYVLRVRVSEVMAQVARRRLICLLRLTEPQPSLHMWPRSQHPPPRQGSKTPAREVGTTYKLREWKVLEETKINQEKVEVRFGVFKRRWKTKGK
jgi:hypothetical protein